MSRGVWYFKKKGFLVEENCYKIVYVLKELKEQNLGGK